MGVDRGPDGGTQHAKQDQGWSGVGGCGGRRGRRANLDASLIDASLIDAPDATPAEQTRAVAVIDRATTRMSRLVEDLLATARRNADALADTDVDLTAIAATRRLFLTHHTQPGLPLIGDPDALRRAAGSTFVLWLPASDRTDDTPPPHANPLNS
jgi:hypothetical protein